MQKQAVIDEMRVLPEIDVNFEVARRVSFIKQQLKQGVPIRAMTRHILGLYHGQNNAKFFRRLLSGKTVELVYLEEWLEFIKK